MHYLIETAIPDCKNLVTGGLFFGNKRRFEIIETLENFKLSIELSNSILTCSILIFYFHHSHLFKKNSFCYKTKHFLSF